MDKQVRVAIFHNEYDGTKAYAEDLAKQIDAETKLIYFRDPHPCADVLPMRASPNVAIMLFVDDLEEVQEKLEVLRRLGYIRKQDAVTEIVDELIEAAGENISEELETKIVETFYEK